MTCSGGSIGGSAEVDFNITLSSSYLKTIIRCLESEPSCSGGSNSEADKVRFTFVSKVEVYEI